MIGVCADCAFFDLSADRCRRHAPQVVTLKTTRDDEMQLTILGVWPAASETDWCGEFVAEARA